MYFQPLFEISRRCAIGCHMAMAGADPFAIMKTMGYADNKTTMIAVLLGMSHIREQVERLNAISLPMRPTMKNKSQDNERFQRPILRLVPPA